MRHGRNDDAFLCTSFPVLARVWNMMSGQAREGRLELRARSRVASSCGRPVCREARDSFLVRCTGQKTHKLGCQKCQKSVVVKILLLSERSILLARRQSKEQRQSKEKAPM